MKRKSDRQEGRPPAKQQNSIKGLRVLQHAKLPDQTGFPREKEQPLEAGSNISKLLAALVISANERPLLSAENQISESAFIKSSDPNLEEMPTELIQLVLDRLVDKRISAGEVRELFEDFESLCRVSQRIKAAVAGSPAARKAELHYYALHLYEDLWKFAETYKIHHEIYQEGWGQELEILDRRLASGEISEEHYDREAGELRPRMSPDSAMEEHDAWCEKFARKFRMLLPNVKYLDLNQQTRFLYSFEGEPFENEADVVALETVRHAEAFYPELLPYIDGLAIQIIRDGHEINQEAFDHLAKAKMAGRLEQGHSLKLIQEMESADFPTLSADLLARGRALCRYAGSSRRADFLSEKHSLRGDVRSF